MPKKIVDVQPAAPVMTATKTKTVTNAALALAVAFLGVAAAFAAVPFTLYSPCQDTKAVEFFVGTMLVCKGNVVSLGTEAKLRVKDFSHEKIILSAGNTTVPIIGGNGPADVSTVTIKAGETVFFPFASKTYTMKYLGKDGKYGKIETGVTQPELSISLDPVNPILAPTRLLGVGNVGIQQEENLLVLAADSTGDDVQITKMEFTLVGSPTAAGTPTDPVHTAFAPDGIKLYHKVGGAEEQLIGTTSISLSKTPGLVDSYTALFNIPDGKLNIEKTTDDKLIVKGIFSGIDTGLTPGTSPALGIGNGNNSMDAAFVTAVGKTTSDSLTNDQINGTGALGITGNQVKIYKSYPTFAHKAVSSTLVNGVENNIYSFSVKAHQGNVSLKQLKFSLDLVDTGNTVNSLAIDSFKFYRGTTNLTNSVIIQTGCGDSLEGKEAFSLCNKYSSSTIGTGMPFYVSWNNYEEEIIPAGSEIVYTIKANPTGFTDSIDGDFLRVRLDNNDATTEDELVVPATNSAPTFYLAPWGPGNTKIKNLLTLDDAILDVNQAPISTHTLLWSDYSAGSEHSAAVGLYAGGTASSTGDWYNGYLVKDLPTNYSLLTK